MLNLNTILKSLTLLNKGMRPGLVSARPNYSLLYQNLGVAFFQFARSPFEFF